MAPRKQVLLAIIVWLSWGITGCATLKNPSKYSFSEGYFKSRLNRQPVSVYVIPEDDSVKVYRSVSLQRTSVDTVSSIALAFPASTKKKNPTGYVFHKNSFDLDFISVLVKYRPGVRRFPNQFNTSILNGAVYVGFRKDIYHVRYTETPFHVFQRQITHYGFSTGLFTGLGASRIDEYVTLNAINIEYDGLVNPTGIAAIIAVDKLTFGLLLGQDHLLDRNKKFWIYQGKPWIGLSVGLNIN